MTKTETGDSNTKMLDKINEKDESVGNTDGSSSMQLSKSKGKYDYLNTINLAEIDERVDDESGSFSYSQGTESMMGGSFNPKLTQSMGKLTVQQQLTLKDQLIKELQEQVTKL